MIIIIKSQPLSNSRELESNSILYAIMKEHERVLKALANRRRLAIMALLKKNKEATVGNIAENIKLSFTSTSKHLNILARVDLLDKRQEGLEIHYRIGPKLPSITDSILRLL
jgi:DNA-binding transcriptional ArsR family regulator